VRLGTCCNLRMSPNEVTRAEYTSSKLGRCRNLRTSPCAGENESRRVYVGGVCVVREERVVMHRGVVYVGENETGECR